MFSQFVYTLSGSAVVTQSFEIHPQTGILTLTQPEILDREKNPQLVIWISALELSPGINLERKPGRVKVTINVQDQNDNSPVFLPGP